MTDAELDRLTALVHPDPHALLGPHPEDAGVVVRTMRPGARNVRLIPERGDPIDMPHRRGGIFEARVPAEALGRGYDLSFTDHHGREHRQRDPYAFSPTLGEIDLHLLGEGTHERLWEKLGAHPRIHEGTPGVAFAVWAPRAAGVSVVGDFNDWDGRVYPMRALGQSGVWELFVPGVRDGERYQFEVRPSHGGPPMMKADPFAFETEAPPRRASVIAAAPSYAWGDGEWMERRARLGSLTQQPLSIYELHLGSWRRVVEDGDRPLTYRELAPVLVEHVKRLGFTHVEFLPLAEHPYGPSWGYQVGSYFAPSARFGTPDDLRFLIDALHQADIGVLVDWVPAHFPRDAHLLGRFDGEPLYEHPDPRRGTQPDWGTFVFDFGRLEVQNFLISNALFWFEAFHVDGLRVDAVASMIYRDYGRAHGEWEPNVHGGRENLEAVAFLKRLNATVRRVHPDVVMIAEESTAWPHVTGPVEDGGLGFHFKWNMGWMHDTLKYFSMDAIFRQHHHGSLTFGLMYAFSEAFVLPLSHDEVVHLKKSLYSKMPGDPWRRRANLRALYAWMWAHPGKKLLFMGGELGQKTEWNHEQSLDWHLLEDPGHRGIQQLLSDVNHLYRAHPALWEADTTQAGFEWIQVNAADVNVLSFVRRTPDGSSLVACVANLSPVPRRDYPMGLPREGRWIELLNTDAESYGGSGMGNQGAVVAHPEGRDGQPAHALLQLPPLGVIWLEAPAPAPAKDALGDPIGAGTPSVTASAGTPTATAGADAPKPAAVGRQAKRPAASRDGGRKRRR